MSNCGIILYYAFNKAPRNANALWFQERFFSRHTMDPKYKLIINNAHSDVSDFGDGLDSFAKLINSIREFTEISC